MKIFHRLVSFFSVLFLFVLDVSAYTVTKTASGSGGSATITWDSDTNLMSWTYTLYGPNTARGNAWMYRQNSTSDTYPNGIVTVFWDVAADGNGTTVTSSGSFTPVADAVYRVYYRTLNGNTVISGSFTHEDIVTTVPDSSQTVHITPDDADFNTATKGKPYAFTASGSHTGYVWTATGGTISTSGAVGTFTSTTRGHGSVSVTAPAGSGYAASGAASVDFDVRGYLTRVKHTNTGTTKSIYVVKQGANVLATFDLTPGQVYDHTFETDTDTEVILLLYQEFSKSDGGSWVLIPANDEPSPVTLITITPIDIPPIEPAPSDDPGSGDPGYIPPPPTQQQQTQAQEKEKEGKPADDGGKKDAGGGWHAITKDNEEAPTTASQFGEGIDKVVSQLQTLNDKVDGANVDHFLYGQDGDPDNSLSATASDVSSALAAYIPLKPVLPTSIGQNGLWSLEVPCPYLTSGHIGFAMDLTQWPVAVSAFRYMILACECITFFYVVVSIVRQAFA